MNWWEILKNAKLSGKTTGKGRTLDSSRINIKKPEDCNEKLNKLQKFLKDYSMRIESVLERTIEKINKDNPPTNKEGDEDNRAGTAPLRLEKIIDDLSKNMVTYHIRTKISRAALSIYVDYNYVPIPEEAACKLIELFNSPSSDDLNINSDYENDLHLHAHRKMGDSTLGYNAPRLLLVAAPFYPTVVKLGVNMDKGFFSTYDNEGEHHKEIYDAIRLKDACDKMISILR